MTIQSEDTRLASAREFVEKVQRLKEDDRGAFAELKRNAGNTLGEARGVAWFPRLLDAEGFKDQEIYFLVATLIGLNKFPGHGDLGHSCQQFWEKTRQQTATEAEKLKSPIARRFNILLDAEFDRVAGGRVGGGELAFRLRQLVKLAASKEVGIDWAQLLVDLRKWHVAGKPVQHAWAEHFYAPDFTKA
jgi:CRISPR type I-E-associated protein CasB/Cse2